MPLKRTSYEPEAEESPDSPNWLEQPFIVPGSSDGGLSRTTNAPSRDATSTTFGDYSRGAVPDFGHSELVPFEPGRNHAAEIAAAQAARWGTRC